MKIPVVILLAVAVSLTSGCLSLSIKKLRDKIPVGYAGEIDGSVVVTGGGGAGFSGRGVEKPSKTVITADEWHEYTITPWGKSELTLKDAGIGKKKPVVVDEAPSK